MQLAAPASGPPVEASATTPRRTLSTISWKCTVTHARSRLRWWVELWISSDTLLKRSCLARLPKTNSIASITFDLPLPLGPTTAEKFWCWEGCVAHVWFVLYIACCCCCCYCWRNAERAAASKRARTHTETPTTKRAARLTLWKGPTYCVPAYDLKFSSTICLIIRRGRGSCCAILASPLVVPAAVYLSTSW